MIWPEPMLNVATGAMESMTVEGAPFSFMFGKVVDMFYFPLFQWNNVPGWLSFLVDHNNYFFGAIFNLADAYISCAVVYLLAFHYRFFQD